MLEGPRLLWKLWGAWATARKEGRMEGKGLLQSKTFYINLLMGLIGVADWATGIVPAEYTPYLIAGAAVVNIVLRLVTKQPIKSITVA